VRSMRAWWTRGRGGAAKPGSLLLALGLAIGLGLHAGPAPSEAALRQPGASADLARIEAYLNSLDSLRSSFVQINPNGGTVTGELYYQRPDKMRLDYDPPSRILIVANGWSLVYHDRRLKQVSHLFTSRTPLGFLLEEEIRLSGKVTVTDVQRIADELMVTLVQSEEPDQGAITLVFAEEPLALRRWTVVDAQGLRTHVVLEDVETGVELDRELFRFRDPSFYPDARRD
jgi:outer membrane lipoprotein-sorting protein